MSLRQETLRRFVEKSRESYLRTGFRVLSFSLRFLVFILRHFFSLVLNLFCFEHDTSVCDLPPSLSFPQRYSPESQYKKSFVPLVTLSLISFCSLQPSSFCRQQLHQPFLLTTSHGRQPHGMFTMVCITKGDPGGGGVGGGVLD